MPRIPKLKVYRTPIGFHDAYVAAASQKAAIEAWGAGKDVFSRGEAEQVTDPALTEEPLAEPGKIVKRLRGTAAEQVAALGEMKTPAPRKVRESASAPDPARKPPPPKPNPRPSRASLEKAEHEVAAAEAKHAEARAELAKREAALARERKALAQEQAREMEQRQALREEAETAFEEALRRWRAES